MYSYKTKGNRIKRFFILLILMGFVSFSSIFIYDMYLKIEVKSYDNNTGISATRLSEEQTDKENTIVVLEEVIKSVVGISKIQNVGQSIFLNNSAETLGLGTGVVVSENGYIITNWHVAGEKYSNCYITLYNSEKYKGTVMWADADLDLAIVKINANGLNYLKFADSDTVKLGETVYAIGNPIGVEFQRTVTSGIISGLNRTVKIEEEKKSSYMEDLIQTDASINSGNSGGPLINKKGEIIGINSVKIISAEGIGFATPINIVKPVIESFINNEGFEEAYLGIFAYDKEVVPYLDSAINFEKGIYITDISIDGPCYNTGLKVGDIITLIDGFEINKMSELRTYIYSKKPNEKVVLNIIRNNKSYKVEVTLEKKT